MSKLEKFYLYIAYIGGCITIGNALGTLIVLIILALV